MISLLTVNDIVNAQAPVLTQETQLSVAIDILLQHQTNGAAVCDKQGKLLGFFSAHDVMTEMWCQDYIPEPNVTVATLMKSQVVTVSPDEHLTDLVEFLALDKEQVHPVTSAGIATRLNALSLEERVKSCRVSRPQILPVMQGDKYLGVVSRKEVLAALRTLFKDSVSVLPQNTKSSVYSQASVA